MFSKILTLGLKSLNTSPNKCFSLLFHWPVLPSISIIIFIFIILLSWNDNARVALLCLTAPWGTAHIRNRSNRSYFACSHYTVNSTLWLILYLVSLACSWMPIYIYQQNGRCTFILQCSAKWKMMKTWLFKFIYIFNLTTSINKISSINFN